MNGLFFSMALVAMVSCKSLNRPPQPLSKVSSTIADQHSVASFQNEAEFNQFALASTSSETMVKFSSHWQDDDLAKPFAELHLINGQKYFGHETFIVRALERYAGLSQDEMRNLIGYGAENIGPSIFLGGLMYVTGMQQAAVNPANPDFLERYKGVDQALIVMPRFSMKPNGTVPLSLEAIRQLKEQINLAINDNWIPDTQVYFAVGWDGSELLKDADLKQQLNLISYSDSMAFIDVMGKSGTQSVIYTPSLPEGSYGKMRFLSSEQVDNGEYDWDDILVVEDDNQRLPLDIGPVAGFISPIRQTAMSHLIFRTQNFAVPNLFLIKDRMKVYGVEELRKIPGSWAKLSASVDSYGNNNISLEPLAELTAEAAAQLNKRRKNLGTLIQTNTSITVPLVWTKSDIAPGMAAAYGKKGENFAKLDNLLRDKGFAETRSSYDNSFLWPSHYYVQHLTKDLDLELCQEKYCDHANLSLCQEVIGTCQQVAKSSTEKSLAAFLRSLTSQINGRYESGAADLHTYRLISLNVIRKVIEEAGVQAATRKAIFPYLEALVQAPSLGSHGFVEQLSTLPPEVDQRLSYRIRFRSSTNAEDLPELNGAGLYSSYAGCLLDDWIYRGINPKTGEKDDSLTKDVRQSIQAEYLTLVQSEISQILAGSKKTFFSTFESCDSLPISVVSPFIKEPSFCQTPREVHRDLAVACYLHRKSSQDYAEYLKDLGKTRSMSETIAKVYASVWNLAAFKDRDYHGIDHFRVHMGLLVHPSYRDELANGVLIVEQKGQEPPVVHISGQMEDISVTNPVFSEFNSERVQFHQGAIKRLGSSNLVQKMNAAQVLSDAQVEELAMQALLIHEHIGKEEKWPKTDIEWKIDERGEIVIKQARSLPGDDLL